MAPHSCVVDAHPGPRASRPHHFPGTALADSAAGMKRQRGRALHSDWPLQFTPAGWLSAGNLALPLHLLQPGIRLRAGRPRSRGGAVRLLGPCRWGSRRRQAACLQPRADAPPPPARNKVAGGTPAHSPGTTLALCATRIDPELRPGSPSYRLVVQSSPPCCPDSSRRAAIIPCRRK